MKKTILFVLALVMITSSSFAFGILTTGTMVGEGKWHAQVQYSTIGLTNHGANGSLAGVGARATYGWMKDLDVFAELWSGSFVVSDFDISQAGGAAGVGLKYAFLKTSANDPIDLAGIAEMASITTNDLTWGMNTIGVSASKLVRPQLTVYGIAAVLMNDWKVKGVGKSVSETSTDLGVGVKYEVNKTFSVLGEVSRFWVDSNIYQVISIACEFVIQ